MLFPSWSWTALLFLSYALIVFCAEDYYKVLSHVPQPFTYTAPPPYSLHSSHRYTWVTNTNRQSNSSSGSPKTPRIAISKRPTVVSQNNTTPTKILATNRRTTNSSS